MTEQEMIDVGNAILKMSLKEVDSLVDVIKHRRSEIHSRARLNFKVGDEVFFTSNRDKPVFGIVSKIAIKYIHVKATDKIRGNVTWRVPAANLSKPQPIE